MRFPSLLRGWQLPSLCAQRCHLKGVIKAGRPGGGGASGAQGHDDSNALANPAPGPTASGQGDIWMHESGWRPAETCPRPLLSSPSQRFSFLGPCCRAWSEVCALTSPITWKQSPIGWTSALRSLTQTAVASDSVSGLPRSEFGGVCTATRWHDASSPSCRTSAAFL